MQNIQRVLYQNLNDVGNARMYLRSLIAMREVASQSDSIFLGLASQGMTNDMFTLLMKILDKTSRAGSFWFLLKKDNNPDSWIGAPDVDFLRSATKQLSHTRNKTHVHTDTQYAFEPRRAWQEANFSGKDLQRVIDVLYESLARKFEQVTGHKFIIPDYDGVDTKNAVRLITGKP